MEAQFPAHAVVGTHSGIPVNEQPIDLDMSFDRDFEERLGDWQTRQVPSASSGIAAPSVGLLLLDREVISETAWS